jgi:Spy/CpxP family protein refolding chaperone
MRLAVLLISVLLPLAAQGPRGAMFNWWDSPIANDLNLSEDQKSQIRATVKEYRTKLIDLRASVEKAEIEVEDHFNADTLDQKKASDALDKLNSARGEMTRNLAQMSLRLRSVLTIDQWRELQKRRPGMMRERMDRMDKMRGGRPFGGPQPGRPMGGPPAGQQPPPPEE